MGVLLLLNNLGWLRLSALVALLAAAAHRGRRSCSSAARSKRKAASNGPIRFKPEALVLGLTLIAVGVVWIARQPGPLDLLATLRAWWPLTLVLWGVLELLAVSVERDARRSSMKGAQDRAPARDPRLSAPPSRRPGASATTSGAGPWGWFVMGGKFYGPSFTFEADQTEAVTAGTPVEVENAFGGVQRRPGRAGRGEGRAAQGRVPAAPRSRRAPSPIASSVQAAREGDTLRIRTNREELDRAAAGEPKSASRPISTSWCRRAPR